MADESAAATMVAYYASGMAQLRGRAVYVQFSNHRELKTDQTHSNNAVSSPTNDVANTSEVCVILLASVLSRFVFPPAGGNPLHESQHRPLLLSRRSNFRSFPNARMLSFHVSSRVSAYPRDLERSMRLSIERHAWNYRDYEPRTASNRRSRIAAFLPLRTTSKSRSPVASSTVLVTPMTRGVNQR